MNPHLFVYGTLRSDCTSRLGRAQRERLAREGRLLGPAVMQGRLYSLGSYPGFADPDRPGEIVHGEVIELCDPANALPWLDSYEGIRPESPELGEYRRQQRDAQLTAPGLPASARNLTVWVYVYARDLSQARVIADGRWPGENRDSHHFPSRASDKG